MTRTTDDLLTDLYARGFDLSREDRDSAAARVRCSQCEALVINGHATHERHCPNERHECRGCNAQVTRRGAYCADCQ